MASTIGFAKTPSSADIMLNRRTPLQSVLRYTTTDGLPGSAGTETMFYTTDTNQFYRGSGKGYPLVPFTDVITVPSRNALPQKGSIYKVYIVKDTHELCYYDEENYINILQFVREGLEEVKNKNQPNGYAGLGEDGKVPAILLPRIASTWEELLNKPELFPPEPHTHEKGDIAEVLDLSDLKDVDVLNTEHGQTLQFDEIKQQWVNRSSTYIHVQIAPSDIWYIRHNLNRYPSTTTVDSGGTVVVGEVQFVDADCVQVVFSKAFGGKAYLN